MNSKQTLKPLTSLDETLTDTFSNVKLLVKMPEAFKVKTGARQKNFCRNYSSAQQEQLWVKYYKRKESIFKIKNRKKFKKTFKK